MVIATEHLSKWYGQVSGLNDVTVAVPSGVFPQNEAYDATRGSWRVLEPMVTPVHGLTGAALANGQILIPGGSLTNGVSDVSTKLQRFRADLDCR